MKKIYALAFLITTVCSSYAQTQPSPRTLPYEQSFESLIPGVTTYPDGWQGWSMGGSLATSTFKITAPTGDKNMISGTAATNTGSVYNYNGKMGFLNSTNSGDQGLVLAINTLGKENISVSFDAMTIRNPYNGVANTRVNELVLQYRVETTGSFTNVEETRYKNILVSQQTAITTPQNPVSYILILPLDANNKPVVQLRWISREVSGGGARPSFAIDGIKVVGSGGDFQPPVITNLSPLNNSLEVSPSTIPILRFSEPVTAVTGKVILHNQTKGTQQVFEINSSQLNIVGNTLTINTKLKPQTQYYIEVEPGTLKDAAGNLFSGLIGNAAWTFTTGPQQLVFEFSTCPTGSTAEFTQYNITGNQVWDCTTFGQTGNGIQINGFAGSAIENEDWLISPAFDLTSFDYPLLSFSTRSKFAGPTLTLMISSDYDGVSNPTNFTWVTLGGRFPSTDSDVWTSTSQINLLNHKSENLYVAFVYHSSPSAGASRWTLDDFKMVNSPTPPEPGVTINTTEFDFDYVPSGVISPIDSFHIAGYNLRSDLTINAPAGFEISRSNDGFGASVLIPKDIAETNNQLYIRFVPTTANTDFKGVLSFQSEALDKNAVSLYGSSLRALKVVNWNIEWFGSTENGPGNEALQQQNVQSILKKINADVYALEEVVDTFRLKQVVDNMPGYAYTISDYGSYTDNVNDPDYPHAQKLAFVYRESVVSKIHSYGILRFGGSENAFYNWASGRFPYLMKANVHLANDTAEVQFVLLHAKANTGTRLEKIEAWHRRKLAADELKDSLDLHHRLDNVIMLGDFNDDFDKTITTELLPDTTTSYINFVRDSNDYKLLTLPLSLADQRSTVSYSSVIDHQVASNEMGIAYVPGSIKILTSVASMIKGYATNTSDHYPVVARYDVRFLAEPIILLQFDAAVDNNQVRLNWATSHEINSSQFIIERSRNSKDFVVVDSIAANGDERDQSNYQFNDKKPWPGKSHYRLQYTLLDGTVYYSNIETVIAKSNSHLIVSNQDNVTTTVKYITEETEKGTLQLIDINGRIHYQQVTDFIRGQNIRQIDTQSLTAGVYIIRVVLKSRIESEKLIIAR